MTLPGEKGRDLLVLLWDDAAGGFHPVAGIAEAADDCVPRANGGATLAGRGVVRDRVVAAMLERLVAGRHVRRWRLVDAEGGVVEGRFRLAGFRVEGGGDHEIACVLNLEPHRPWAVNLSPAAGAGVERSGMEKQREKRNPAAVA
jgi:hypothetical protein